MKSESETGHQPARSSKEEEVGGTGDRPSPTANAPGIAAPSGTPPNGGGQGALPPPTPGIAYSLPPGMAPGIAPGYPPPGYLPPPGWRPGNPYGGMDLAQLAGLGDGAGPAAQISLRFYWTQIRRHLLKILAGVCLVTFLSAILTEKIPKLYESSVTLRVDPGSDLAVSLLRGRQYASGSDDFETAELIRTEIDEAQSRAVALEAIRDAHLDQNSTINPHPHDQRGTLADPDAQREALVPAILNMVTAYREGRTQNFVIAVRSTDFNTAAVVANALANALITHDYKSRLAAANRSNAWMMQQLEAERVRLEKAKQALTEYQTAHGVVDTGADRAVLFNDRLTAINTGLSRTQAELIANEADLQIIRRDHLNGMLATSARAQIYPVYRRWESAQQAFEQIQQRNGPRDPVYQLALLRRNEARHELAVKQRQVYGQIETAYQDARAKLRLQQAELDSTKQQLTRYNADTSEYSLLLASERSHQDLYDRLQQEVNEADLAAGVQTQHMRITDPAIPNGIPVYPDVRQNVVHTFVLSLLIFCGLAVGAGFLDRSFTTPEQVEQELGIQLLGALPAVSGNRADLSELLQEPVLEEASRPPTRRSPFAEAMLTLRTAVLFASPERMHTLALSSSHPQEGKSSIAANLAAALALHGSKVLLLDADIRRPSVHRIFDCANRVGLSSVLQQRATLEEAIESSPLDHLFLMPAGPSVPNPAELLSTGLSSVLEPLKGAFDYILIDCPALLGFADSLTAASIADGVIMVARAGKTPREDTRLMLQQLRRVRANVLGMILNGVSVALSPHYAYYQRRSYYQRDPDTEG